ncbi:MAG TPA: beta-propeller fold lactonase family protein [Acidobacteriaceae bacterium]|nr:beta-propeller fold lactonase family protein [Acidobacteriaceae bacterium]
MKFSKFGRITLALVVSLGTGFGVTSCSTDHTVGYFYVTGTQYSQISGYRIDNNLGNLYPVQNSPFGSGGYDPIKALVATAGKFLYVLNAGCGQTGQTACPSGTNPTNAGANISLFTIGGQGGLSFQAAYTSQGNLPISMAVDSSGSHLFVLDSTAPDPTTCASYGQSGFVACGDITAFNIDPNTGRLSLITNQTVQKNGTNLTYFPVGSGPINLALTASNGYVYVIEKGVAGSTSDPPQAVFVYANSSGQLTLSQNTPIATNAIQLSYIYASAKYIYLIDAQDGTTPGYILPYTTGTNGALQSLVGGQVENSGTVANPGPMIVDHQGKFLYLADQGPNLTPSSEASSVSAFFIDPTTGRLTPLATSVPFGSGSSPQCILEDPSNQYLYTANFADSTVTGAIINSATGTLTNLRKATSFPAAGQPTWCAASGTLF